MNVQCFQELFFEIQTDILERISSQEFVTIQNSKAEVISVCSFQFVLSRLLKIKFFPLTRSILDTYDFIRIKKFQIKVKALQLIREKTEKE